MKHMSKLADSRVLALAQPKDLERDPVDRRQRAAGFQLFEAGKDVTHRSGLWAGAGTAESRLPLRSDNDLWPIYLSARLRCLAGAGRFRALRRAPAGADGPARPCGRPPGPRWLPVRVRCGAARGSAAASDPAAAMHSPPGLRRRMPLPSPVLEAAAAAQPSARPTGASTGIPRPLQDARVRRRRPSMAQAQAKTRARSPPLRALLLRRVAAPTMRVPIRMRCPAGCQWSTRACAARAPRAAPPRR